MLVLTRKKNQSVQFPNVGISVEILRVDGNTVRVGVDAPREIRVLRGELVDEQSSQELGQKAREERHELRNHLNTANLALHMMQKQLDAGRFAEAEQMLTQALNSFEHLDRLVTKPNLDQQQKHPDRSNRALVVEDNANERQLLAGFLELNGYQVDSVEDGAAAMAYLETHECPDLVLLDMNMPRMDGPTTIRAIRANPKFQGLKLFVVSGAEQEEMEIPAGNRGIDHWFSKPLKPAKFVQDLSEEMARTCSLN